MGLLIVLSLLLSGIMLAPPADSGIVEISTNALIPHAPIRIDSDADFTLANGVSNAGTGDGSAGNPWVIENLEIDGALSGNCIYVGNTTEYFIIQNCNLSNSSGLVSQSYFSDAGIVLYDVQNGHILNNIIFNIIGKEGITGGDAAGVYLMFSDYNIIEFNTIFNITGGNRAPYQNPGKGWGILVDALSHDNIVKNNEISNIGTGSVVFFKDNMENGAMKWTHSSTLALINGEEPLEYVFATELDTDVMGEWNSSMSAGGTYINTAAHSFPESFYLEEPVAGNTNKTAVTDTFNLTSHDSATLSFWHKYNLTADKNGVFLQVGYKNTTLGTADDWDWKYISPASYTGNINASEFINDTWGNPITDCWNNISGGGTYDWEYVEIDLRANVPDAYSDEVRVKFNYTQFGGGSGDGWYVDDVRITASRLENATIEPNFKDVWQMTNTTSHSGSNCWSNVDPATGNVKPGIDNSLTTVPIDLTNAMDVDFTAYMKFNLNQDAGAPPDGFRVEVTTDGGLTWTAINLGVRAAWNISGTGEDAEDGNATDGKAYSGLTDSGDPVADDYWVEASTLSRINANLSSFCGNIIQMRFRMVTSNNISYQHNNSLNSPYPGFGGFYLDDVEVRGRPIIEMLDGRGIGLLNSDDNKFYENSITNCYYGANVVASDNNLFYHNNFLNNTTQARDTGTNLWDNGYPSGGNHWSDYSGVDDFYGPSQNIDGGDGFGDTNYPIFAGANIDNYPIMFLYVGQPLGPSVAVPPLALNYTPNSTATPIDATIQIAWNETMNWTSVNGSFSYTDLLNNYTSANGTWLHDSVNNISTFTPTDNFAYETQYFVAVNITATDIIGNMLDQDGNGTGGEWPQDVLEWNFTTVDESPYVLSTSPANAQVDVDPNIPIIITFSEPMNQSAVEEAFSYTNGTVIWNTGNGTEFWNADRTVFTFVPVPVLERNQTFIATLNGSMARDIGGNIMGPNYTWTFTTWLHPPPPHVTDTYPPSGAFNVPVNTYINLAFDVEMDIVTVQDAFSYTDGTGTWDSSSGTVDWYSGNTLFSFQPTEVLNFDSTYTIVMGTNASSIYGKTLDGNDNGVSELNDDFVFTFTTSLEPPTIVSHYPAPDQYDVSTSLTAIYINFSKPMDTTSVTNGVSIYPNTNYMPSFSADQRNLTLLLNDELIEGAQYRVTVMNTAQDLVGTSLDGNGDGASGDRFSFVFITEGMVTIDRPRIVNIFPSRNSTIPIDSFYVAITFSQEMNRTSVLDAFSFGNSTTEINGTFTWSVNGNAVRFMPNDPLEYNETYFVSVAGTARNIDGLSIGNSTSWEYNTESEEVPASLGDLVFYAIIIILLVLTIMLYMANRSLRTDLRRNRVKLKRAMKKYDFTEDDLKKKKLEKVEATEPEGEMPEIEEPPDEVIPEEEVPTETEALKPEKVD